MLAFNSCPQCATPLPDNGVCRNCGHGGGGNIAIFLAWAFVPLLIPIYPIMGAIGTASLFTTSIVLDQFSLGGMRFVLTAIVTYGALFLSHGLEARASRGHLYRTVRRIARMALFAVLAYIILQYATPAVLIAGVVGLSLLWWMMRGFDRLLGLGGPPSVSSDAMLA
jgi:hypothetical protein